MMRCTRYLETCGNGDDSNVQVPIMYVRCAGSVCMCYEYVCTFIVNIVR